MTQKEYKFMIDAALEDAFKGALSLPLSVRVVNGSDRSWFWNFAGSAAARSKKRFLSPARSKCCIHTV